MSDLVIYQFSRERVEAGDFSHFLKRFSPAALPAGSALAAQMDSLVCAIDGYDSHPDELHSIPAVRSFYAAFHRAWPYWLYFCNLEDESLKMMVLSCLETLSAVKIAGQPNCVVEFDPVELVRFLAADFLPMNALCERAGCSEAAIYHRSKAVFEYFGLPYDAPPP